ncbi:CheR family methyltransferase [Massilia niastensis]|uniref:CheR family methyltransferase n=1 Tax=Massilia niastensis TaxID=544911 RepID=UPI0003818071|nr:CheR family methyltransferase [Massilia niastensis]
MEIHQPDQAPPSTPPPPLPFPIVGIGASAGGLQALTTLLENMPPAPGMSLVVILHLATDQPSAADKVLQGATGMPVVQVNHAMPILPEQVYVIPPGRALKMRDGWLLLEELDRSSPRPVTIDIFLRSLAEVHAQHAIGIVLSGMGSDGTAGLAAIKEMGGVTIAQLPTDAEQGSMPRSAIDSGMADFVLGAAEIPRKLVELRDISNAIRQKVREGHRPGLDEPAPFDMGPQPEAALRDVLALLHARTGHDFTHYKRQTLLRRLERRLQVRGAPDLVAYHAVLQKDSSEARALLKDLLIGVTGFYRDREAFDALQRIVLPEIYRSVHPDQTVRAWVAACSTGEEAYTLAMMLADRNTGKDVQRPFQVFASDIDEQAIHAARLGLYPASIAEHVPPGQLERYFTLEANQYKVRKALRDQVLFARHNLLQDPAFSRLDLISCRNFLIYLNREMHRQLLQQFHFALNPGGYLMLGSAESVDAAADLFAPVDAANRIYQARPVSRDPPGLPAMPAGVARPAGAPKPASMLPGRRRGRLFSFGEIHLHKVAALAPPSILLDTAGDIVHVSEHAARFLHQPGGQPTRELVALVLPELRLALRVALFQAQKGASPASSGPVRYERHGEARVVDMRVLPFQDEHADGALMLVEFLDAPEAPAQPLAAPSPQESGLAHQLDEELRLTRRKLQETIEQAESHGSEMRVYAEEMQTSIDELRAKADEMERSNRELRSSLQELMADNRQLRLKAEEATKAHDDLGNLIASSGVATIFLDRDMRILRYTPRIADFFNVIPSDIGRPLPDITNKLDYPQLAAEAAEVFETLQSMEREVHTGDGHDYIVRVHPYRTTADRIEGAVMTLFDISSRRAAEEALRESESRLSAVFDSLPVGVGVSEADGVLLLSNQQMRRYLPTGIIPSRDDDRLWRWRSHHPDGSMVRGRDFPDARALRGELVVPGIDMLYARDDGREIWTQVAAAPVRDHQGRLTGQAVVVVTDIDALKRADAAVLDNDARLRGLLEGLAQAVWEADAEGRIVSDSPSWRAYTGQTPQQWLGDGWTDAIHPDDRGYVLQQWRDALAARRPVNAEFRLQGPQGGWRRTWVRAAPLFNADGSIRKWVGMNVDVEQRR